MKKIKGIALCSSASHYEKLFSIKKDLEKMGFRILMPKTALLMKKKNNFERMTYQPWHKNPKEYYKKRALMNNHFRKIKRADAILVANFEKNGIKGYIGGNVFMEIAIAYFLKKPVFILNDINDDFPIREELNAINAIFLKGNLVALNS